MQKSVLITTSHNRSTRGSSGSEKSTEKSVMWRERQIITMSPIEGFFSCLLVEGVHYLQIEIPRRLGCEKPCGGKSVVRARLHV